ncbi:hypothetical protein GSU68_10435 [Rathayibacter sp. VKM Ac-2759]|uniref:hypothetical protein n=1 Tax=Rathayibacter sp. VKM Ac-2759 TaxID=2609252 RepID=UPI001316F76B|nr:hypothetical protein [Rathayibacter sp. VKM Ac-2759]QHC66937.1 hypothetical protein GSU68_10435 [Rathayibacter sp. VKM Ac-2759]
MARGGTGRRAAGTDGAATAALVFGVLGVFLAPIPLFIGLVLGGLMVLAIFVGAGTIR